MILTTRLYPSSCELAYLWSDTRFANLRSLNNTEFDDDNKEMAVVFQMQLSTSTNDLNNASEELKFDRWWMSIDYYANVCRDGTG